MLWSFHSYPEFIEPLSPECIMGTVIFSFSVLSVTPSQCLRHPHVTTMDSVLITWHTVNSTLIYLTDHCPTCLPGWAGPTACMPVCNIYYRRDTQAGQYNPDVKRAWGNWEWSSCLFLSSVRTGLLRPLAEFCVVPWEDYRLRALEGQLLAWWLSTVWPLTLSLHLWTRGLHPGVVSGDQASALREEATQVGFWASSSLQAEWLCFDQCDILGCYIRYNWKH